MSDVISRRSTALEGRYRVEREMGEGGMAIDNLAENLWHERKVTLQVLKPKVAEVVEPSGRFKLARGAQRSAPREG